MHNLNNAFGKCVLQLGLHTSVLVQFNSSLIYILLEERFKVMVSVLCIGHI